MIEGNIHEEAQRVARLDPRDNKFNIDGIAADLKAEGDRIDSFFDEWKILRDENYPRANEIGGSDRCPAQALVQHKDAVPDEGG